MSATYEKPIVAEVRFACGGGGTLVHNDFMAVPGVTANPTPLKERLVNPKREMGFLNKEFH